MPQAPCPVLYSFRRCPYAMRARLALHVSGQVCELREVVLVNKPAALLQASPKGTVPVLVEPNGSVLDQSLDIMLWALRRHDPAHWLGTSDAPTDAMLHWVTRCDSDFKFHLDRYKYPNRFGLVSSTESRTQGAVFLHDLDQQLRQHPYLMGAHFSLADAALAPFVRQFAHTNPAWFGEQPWAPLQNWLAGFENSILFLQVMQRYEAWQPGQTPVYFPQQTGAIK